MKRKMLAIIMVAIISMVSIALALNFGAQTFEGLYVPVRVTYDPPRVDLGNVTTDDVIVYNITISNHNRFAINVTHAISTPAFIVASLNTTVARWEPGTYRVIPARQNMTVTTRIMIGIPLLPDVPVRFNGTFVFFGTKVK